MGYVTFAALSDFLSPLPTLNLSYYASQIAAATNNALPTTTTLHLLQIQEALLTSGTPDAEIFTGTTAQLGEGPSSYIANAFWLLMPFSRGNIHVTSSDPAVMPAINPNFFLVDFDLTVQVAIAKWLREFWDAEALQGYAPVEISPGLDVVPEGASDEVWGEWVKSSCEFSYF